MKRYESAQFDHTNAMGIGLSFTLNGFWVLLLTIVACQFTWWGLMVLPAYVVLFTAIVWHYLNEEIEDGTQA